MAEPTCSCCGLPLLVAQNRVSSAHFNSAGFSFPSTANLGPLPLSSALLSRPLLLTMGLTYGQQLSLVIAPKISGLFSCLASLWVMLDVSLDPSKRKKLNHSILLGFSIVDFVVSAFFVASTWPIPAETPNIQWAAGNSLTCRLQGFIIQFGSASFIYNSILTVYFVLVVRYSVKEQTLKRYEWLFHGIPWAFGLGTAITALVMDMYHNSVLWCWIGGFGNLFIYRWAFYYAPLWFCFVVVLVGMTMIVWGVREKERQTTRLDDYQRFERAASRQSDTTPSNQTLSSEQPTRRRSSLQRNRKGRNTRTRQVATQCILYSE